MVPESRVLSGPLRTHANSPIVAPGLVASPHALLVLNIFLFEVRKPFLVTFGQVTAIWFRNRNSYGKIF